nr:hypothetical protein Iba_chr11cCG8780 [Ipomoea batatas]
MAEEWIHASTQEHPHFCAYTCQPSLRSSKYRHPEWSPKSAPKSALTQRTACELQTPTLFPRNLRTTDPSRKKLARRLRLTRLSGNRQLPRSPDDARLGGESQLLIEDKRICHSTRLPLAGSQPPLANDDTGETQDSAFGELDARTAMSS